MTSEINIIKKFASWNNLPKSVINSIINKTLNTPSITEDFYHLNETSNEVTIFVSLAMALKVVHLNLAFAKSNQTAEESNQLPSEFYMASQKLISSVVVGKTERTLFERNVEYA